MVLSARCWKVWLTTLRAGANLGRCGSPPLGAEGMGDV